MIYPSLTPPWPTDLNHGTFWNVTLYDLRRTKVAMQRAKVERNKRVKSHLSAATCGKNNNFEKKNNTMIFLIPSMCILDVSWLS